MSDSKTVSGSSDQEEDEKSLTDSSNESESRRLLKQLWGLRAPVSPSTPGPSEEQEELDYEAGVKAEMVAEMKEMYPNWPEEQINEQWELHKGLLL